MKEEKSFFKLMQKVPGGLIIVPMLIGVLANTFIPNVLEIGGLHLECSKPEPPVC